MVNKCFGVLLISLVAFAGAGSAQATVISAGCVTSLSAAAGPNVSGSSTCNAFDQLLGTLTDVNVHYSAGVAVSVHNTTAGPLITEVAGQFQFSPFPFSAATARTGIMSNHAGVAIGATGGASASAHFSVDVSNIPHALDYFSGGAGGHFSLAEQITGYHMDVAAFSPDWVLESMTGFVGVTIDYTYDAREVPPADVPEPGSLALAALGLAVFGLGRRNRA